jgi:single-stranded-DNA-specific exonuclease
VEAAHLADLTAFLNERVEALGLDRTSAPDIGVDGAVSAGAATPELVASVERVGPFGVGNAEPRFAVANARVVRADVVGADHVRCILSGGDGARLKAIAFRAAGKPVGQALINAGGAPLHLAGHLRADRWQGREGAQLVIDDVALAGP